MSAVRTEKNVDVFVEEREFGMFPETSGTDTVLNLLLADLEWMNERLVRIKAMIAWGRLDTVCACEFE